MLCVWRHLVAGPSHAVCLTGGPDVDFCVGGWSPALETSALLQKLSGLWEMGFSTSVSFNRDVLPQADMEGGVGS